MAPESPGASLRLAGALWIACLASAALLGGAWYFELVLNLLPCKLCLEQRYPHYLTVIVAVFGLILAWGGRPDTGPRICIITLMLTLAASAAMGGYHAGVEWSLWPGPSDCGGRLNSGPVSAGTLLEAMRNTRVVSCTEAAWRFLGLSLAGWNAVFSTGLALFMADSLWRR